MAFWEICFLLPRHLEKTYNIEHTKWAIISKAEERLMGTVWRGVNDLFPNHSWDEQKRMMEIQISELSVDLYFRSLDQDDSMDKIRSLMLTGAVIDEASEVSQGAKELLITRLGRFPENCPVRYLIETEHDGRLVNHILGTENFGLKYPF